MREQKSLEMNYWLRARVITQGEHVLKPPILRRLHCNPTSIAGFTILAISWSAGIWERLFPGTAQMRPGLLGPLPPSAVGVLEGPEARKAQFEERMKKAEEAHKAEMAAEVEAAPKKIVISSKTGNTKAMPENHDLNGGYWKWLRWGSGSVEGKVNSSPPPSPYPLPQPISPSVGIETPKPSGSWLRSVTGMSSGSEKDKKS
jgi:hypothetical protein